MGYRGGGEEGVTVTESMYALGIEVTGLVNGLNMVVREREP